MTNSNCSTITTRERKVMYNINPLPLIFKSLLPGQEDCVFFSGHLNLHAKPETGISYREKIITIKLKKTE
jgi:hypothetical protein